MDLFDAKSIEKLNKDSGKFKDFTSGKLNLQVFSSRDPTTSSESLLHVKILYQKMLPKMPRDYILRQVFDDRHSIMTLNEVLNEKEGIFRIIGGILFRPAFERSLVEIVFLAVDSDYHVNGYGSFIFSCFKEVVKLLHLSFLKYGDSFRNKNIMIKDLSIFDNIDDVNLADIELLKVLDGTAKKEIIKPSAPKKEGAGEHNVVGTVLDSKLSFEAPLVKGYPEVMQDPYTDMLQGKKLKKYSQLGCNLYLLTYADNSAIGFFKKQGFSLNPRSNEWMGFIKDYEGGTLMECKVYAQINYLKKKEILERARKVIFEEMKKINDFHILRSPEEKESLRHIVDVHKRKLNQELRTRELFIKDFLYYLLCTVQSHPSAWPFLEPVSSKEVPEYLDTIKHPMDLSLMMSKLKSGKYPDIKSFSSDIYLMCKNCCTFNPAESQYYKCAENIEKYYNTLIKNHKSVINSWGYEV